MSKLLMGFGFFVAFFIIIFQVVTKALPLWVYLAAAVALGIFLYLLIWWLQSPRWVKYTLLSLTAVLITGLYFIGTRFSVLPFGDPYAQYGLLQYSLDNGKLMSEFPPSANYSPSAAFSMYGEWPGTQLLGVAFALITGVNGLNTALLLPLAYKLVAILLLLILMHRLMTDLKLDTDPYLAFIMVITSSWLLLPPFFFYQQFAICLWFGCLYLIYLLTITPHSVELLLLLLLLSFALVIVHHTTPLILLLYLLFFTILFFIKTRRTVKSVIPNMKTSIDPHSWVSLSLCVGVVLGSWWLFFSTGVWKHIPSRIQLLWHAITTGDFQIYLFQEYGVTPPSVTYPLWGTVPLMIRDVVILLSVLVGYLLIFFKSRPSHTRTVFLTSLLFAALLTFVDVVFIKVAVYREIGMFMPFWVLCAVAAFGIWKRYGKKLAAVLNLVLVTLLVFTSLTGLWGNRYLPVFLYDPRVSAVEAGDHSLDWKYVANALGNKIDYSQLDRIITDEKYDMSLIVPLDYWQKIEVAGLKDVHVSGYTATFMFRDFNIRQTYIEQAMGGKYDPEFNASAFKADVDNQSNLIYTSGTIQVWLVDPR